MADHASILAISDVHLGCPRLDSRKLHERFIKFLYPKITSDIDILFICGDFFDSGLSMNSVAAMEAMSIIRELKELCCRVGCDLRILRGTFTHDRRQPMHFTYNVSAEDKRVRLFDTMSVEYHEKTGLNILYIPDNIPTNDRYKDIRDLLDAHNLDKVDIIIHHGYFQHMLPPNIPAPNGCLDQEKLSKFVKGCVLNGHVHLTSIFRNVISIGSFDRLVHGEEGPKGFYRIDIDKGEYKFSFIENEDANKFYTFDLRGFGHEVECAINNFSQTWQDKVKTFKDNEEVHIRFLSDDQGIVEGGVQLAKSLYDNVVIDKSQVVKREQIIENVQLELSELPILTPANLEEMLMPILKNINPNVDQQVVHGILKVCEGKESA